jgi:hypothetical protein
VFSKHYLESICLNRMSGQESSGSDREPSICFNWRYGLLWLLSCPPHVGVKWQDLEDAFYVVYFSSFFFLFFFFLQKCQLHSNRNPDNTLKDFLKKPFKHKAINWLGSSYQNKYNDNKYNNKEPFFTMKLTKKTKRWEI